LFAVGPRGLSGPAPRLRRGLPVRQHGSTDRARHASLADPPEARGRAGPSSSHERL